MNRTRSILAGAVLLLGLAAILPASLLASNSSKTAKSTVGKTTTIVVTAGKPSELGFKLSKISAIPAGTVIFKVKNSGKIAHTFEICTKSSAGSTANKCVGKTTPMLQPGKSATITVKLTKTGKYEYLCTVPGHAGAGMKGLIGIGVKVVAPKPKPTTTSTTSTPTTTTSGPTTSTPAATCASPVATTLNVSMLDFSFAGVPGSIPCGTVTIIETNNGGTGHNFDLQGVSGADLPVINPSASSTATVTVLPGKYTYSCDVTGHVALGMIGSLTVTG